LGKRGEDYEATIARKIRDGRGLGEFKSYKPWLEIHEFPSKGRSHIVLSTTVGREHHLLSDLEEVVFLYADFSPHVMDIREQFPLFPRTETAAIAEEMDLKHPAHCGSNDVLTKDFIFTMRDPAMGMKARQVKYSKDLSDLNVRTKLEIQRRYFARLKIDWKIITERDLNPAVTRNLWWLRRGAMEVFPDVVADEFTRVLMASRPSDPLNRAIQRAGQSVNLERDQAALLFQRLVWTHDLEIDVQEPLELSSPIDSLRLHVSLKSSQHERAV